MADQRSEAVKFSEVLNQELAQIQKRREKVVEGRRSPGAGFLEEAEPDAGEAPRPGPPTATTRLTAEAKRKEELDAQKQARLNALDRHHVGLALSGGGIRSATFSLGVLQGLATLKLLSRIDYLSTVSGGGYIGGWLAAWIKREGNLEDVEAQLAPSRIRQAEALGRPEYQFDGTYRPERRAEIGGRIVDEEPRPIHHLRAYSNYLTPRPGLLSLDTWTLFTIYVRNFLINGLLLFPMAMIVVLIVRAVVVFFAVPTAAGVPSGSFCILVVLALLILAGFSFLGRQVYRLNQATGTKAMHVTDAAADSDAAKAAAVEAASAAADAAKAGVDAAAAGWYAEAAAVAFADFAAKVAARAATAKAAAIQANAAASVGVAAAAAGWYAEAAAAAFADFAAKVAARAATAKAAAGAGNTAASAGADAAREASDAAAFAKAAAGAKTAVDAAAVAKAAAAAAQAAAAAAVAVAVADANVAAPAAQTAAAAAEAAAAAAASFALVAAADQAVADAKVAAFAASAATNATIAAKVAARAKTAVAGAKAAADAADKASQAAGNANAAAAATDAAKAVAAAKLAVAAATDASKAAADAKTAADARTAAGVATTKEAESPEAWGRRASLAGGAVVLLVILAILLVLGLWGPLLLLLAGALFLVFWLLAVVLKPAEADRRPTKQLNPGDPRAGISPNRFFLWMIFSFLPASTLAAWLFTSGPGPKPLEWSIGRSTEGFALRLPDFIRDFPPKKAGCDSGYSRVVNSLFSSNWLTRNLGSNNTPERWKEQHFPWLSAIQVGVWFGTLGLVGHLFSVVVARAHGVTLATGELHQQATAAGGGGSEEDFWAAWRLTSDEAHLLACAPIAGFTGGMLFVAMISQILWPLRDYPAAVATVGPPLSLLVLVVGLYMDVWLAGTKQAEEVREWWARACAVLTIVAFGWAALFATVVYGPYLLHFIRTRTASQAINWGVVLAWLSTVVGGAFAGRKEPADPGLSSLPRKLLLVVTPPLFVVGIFALVSSLAGIILEDPLAKDSWPAGSAWGELAKWSPDEDWVYWHGVRSISPSYILWLGLLSVAAVAIVWGMTDVNVYSLNAMYANRLTRCYLGASRTRESGAAGTPTTARGLPRQANLLTGFDPDDDLPLSDLRIGAATGGVPGKNLKATTYWGPQLIVNTALNLVAGEELAWQNRMAESFVLTPDYCGSKGTGYARTPRADEGELKLGRAVAISGAAVDSNIGVQQSSALIALMTAFNARLGWWIQNPNPDPNPELDPSARNTLRSTLWSWLTHTRPRPGPWDAGGPSAGRPFLLELLGLTDAKREYVHLSDGGHFENLAVYELIRRRCRYIICVDSGTDRGASDDNLANMIRLVRTDFGVRIDIDTSPLRTQGDDKISQWHCVVGKIHYDDLDQGERPGVLVLLRTSMTGDEPPDVQEYAAKNPDFPGQSTLDQFFDEPQFESYRALGHHVATSAFTDALDDLDAYGGLWGNLSSVRDEFRNNQRLFSAVQRRWAPAPAMLDATYAAAAQGWVDVQKTLRKDRLLVRLDADLYPELLSGSIMARREFHAVAEMLQVMNNAWLDLRMRGQHDLPKYRSWLSVFRRWSATAAFRRYWPILRTEFGQEFGQFCENQLGLRAYPAVVHIKMDDNPPCIERLQAEFAREWPGPKVIGPASLRDHVYKGETGGKPYQFAWLVVQSDGEINTSDPYDPARHFACGIAALLGSAGGKEFEFFVWLQPAYRAMGIGGLCAKQILKEIRDYAAQFWPAGSQRTVSVKFPRKVARDDTAFDIWRNFFFRYDFKLDGDAWKEGKAVLKRSMPLDR